MYEIEVDQQNSNVKIIFSGALTIQNSIAINEGLRKPLNQSNTLLINHEKVDEFDLTYLQLLLSLHKSTDSLHKTLIITGHQPEAFIKCLKDSGLPLNTWIIGESEQESIGVIEYD